MASINTNKEQLNALNQVNVALSEISDINAMLSPDSNGTMQIVFSSGKGRGAKSIKVDVTVADVQSILNRKRAKLIKDVKAKTAKFDINLDDSDKAIIGEITQLQMEDTPHQEDGDGADDAPVQEGEDFGGEGAPDQQGEGEQPHELTEEEEFERMLAAEAAEKQAQENGGFGQ